MKNYIVFYRRHGAEMRSQVIVVAKDEKAACAKVKRISVVESVSHATPLEDE